jgi:serine-type D-Ala-D-Ala carboxypeptidase/endopeptidase (penicillin-binding protein 4)
MRRALTILLAGGLLLLPAGASQASVKSTLKRSMSQAGSSSSAYVVNATDGKTVFSWHARTARVLASNTKLFTSSAALARFGVEGTLGTEVVGRGELDEDGVWRGNLYLRGGGDPTFGSRRFVRRAYGAAPAVEDLAQLLQDAGIARVTGRVVGDESRFDSLRGGPDSGYATTIDMQPLSALALNHGFADDSGRAYQTNPPLFAAKRLDAALEKQGVRVRLAPRAGTAPADADVLASVDSPPMERIVYLMNKPSDNWFAEMLAKGLALQANGTGTTSAGARVAAAFARRLGSGASLLDGSGLSRSDRASPYRIVKLLLAMMQRDEFDAFYASLPIAGRDGTLSDRMRSGPARGNCRAKTGTLSDVSALSGYCQARSGDVYAFSILMNRVYTPGARTLQDRMAQTLAGVRD